MSKTNMILLAVAGVAFLMWRKSSQSGSVSINLPQVPWQNFDPFA